MQSPASSASSASDLPEGVLSRVRRHVLRAARAYAKRGLAWNRDHDASHAFTVRSLVFSIMHEFSDGPEAVDDEQAGEVRVVARPQYVPDGVDVAWPEALVVFDHDGRGEVFWQHEEGEGGAARSRAPAGGDAGTAPPPQWPVYAFLSIHVEYVPPGPPYFQSREEADAYWKEHGAYTRIIELPEARGALCPHCEGALALWLEHRERGKVFVTGLCIDEACAAEVEFERDEAGGRAIVTDPGTPRGEPRRPSGRSNAARAGWGH